MTIDCHASNKINIRYIMFYFVLVWQSVWLSDCHTSYTLLFVLFFLFFQNCLVWLSVWQSVRLSRIVIPVDYLTVVLFYNSFNSVSLQNFNSLLFFSLISLTLTYSNRSNPSPLSSLLEFLLSIQKLHFCYIHTRIYIQKCCRFFVKKNQFVFVWFWVILF